MWGLALDVRPTEGARWLEQHGGRYGLYRVYDNEWWHFEYRTPGRADCRIRMPRPGCLITMPRTGHVRSTAMSLGITNCVAALPMTGARRRTRPAEDLRMQPVSAVWFLIWPSGAGSASTRRGCWCAGADKTLTALAGAERVTRAKLPAAPRLQHPAGCAGAPRFSNSATMAWVFRDRQPNGPGQIRGRDGELVLGARSAVFTGESSSTCSSGAVAIIHSQSVRAADTVPKATCQQHIVGVSKIAYSPATPRCLDWTHDLQRTGASSGQPHLVAGTRVLPGRHGDRNHGLRMRAGRGRFVPAAGAPLWRTANHYGGGRI